ncbi:hypothetical protein Rs2_35582 [Raphanus sativus]|nr:hypothetical protein Rs2_35582 [Raphanus sativus]
MPALGHGGSVLNHASPRGLVWYRTVPALGRGGLVSNRARPRAGRYGLEPCTPKDEVFLARNVPSLGRECSVPNHSRLRAGRFYFESFQSQGRENEWCFRCTCILIPTTCS